jgi:hypothetical protein
MLKLFQKLGGIIKENDGWDEIKYDLSDIL